jgi:L-fuculose-phosphate aldolase
MKTTTRKAVSSSQSRLQLNKFFNGPKCRVAKRQICEMGRRLWLRGYVEGNGGNLAIRVGGNLVVCTPTQISKGFMRPDDLCLVDLDGNQLLGSRPRTSEILMHLEIMKQQPLAVATCHAHPAHATAFSMSGQLPPQDALSEYELVCSASIAPYRTPGSPELGRAVARQAEKHNTILMASHGVVTWSHRELEEAFWLMETIEACCRTFVIARQLGKPLRKFNAKQRAELLRLKRRLGFVDPRF